MGKGIVGENPGFIKNLVMAQTVVTISELITYPIDTVRRRMMMQAGKKKSK
jgi:solute carrier family 25 (adenine nucleotide translocator) protein 4/5/6/31